MINIFLDGTQGCALLGGDLQEGLAGFGDTPASALRALADEIELKGWNF